MLYFDQRKETQKLRSTWKAINDKIIYKKNLKKHQRNVQTLSVNTLNSGKHQVNRPYSMAIWHNIYIYWCTYAVWLYIHLYFYVHKLLQGMFIYIISNDIRWLFAVISDVAQYHKYRMCDAVLCLHLYCFRVLLCWLSPTAEAWSLEASWRSLKSRKVLLLQPGLAAEKKSLKNRRIGWFPKR